MKNNPLQIIYGITGVSSSCFYKRMHDLKQINIEAFHTHLIGKAVRRLEARAMSLVLS